MSYFIPPGPPPSRLMPSRSAPGKKRQSTGSAPAIPSEHATLLATIADEVRDSGRVQRQGQEEDLRDALGRMMLRVEELCTLLKASAAAKSELETQLAIAQSNLKMSLANNDMLEDALKRSSGAKDVGWRRSAATPVPAETHDDSPPARSSSENAEGEASPPPTATISSAPATQDSRFFRFRFSSGRTTPQPPGSPPLSASRSTPGHLTSASLPSLVPLAAPEPDTKELDDAKAELEKARAALEAERTKLARAMEDKTNLEGELESLSQALFEEANKMVAQERIKRAEAEEELGEARAEKEALRAALRLIEEERMRASDSETERMRATHSRSSSQIALKSPRAKSPPLPTDQAGTDSDEVEAVLVSSPGSPPSEPGELVETPTETAADEPAESIKPPPRTSSMFLNGVVLEPSPSLTPESTTPDPEKDKGQTIMYAPNSSDSLVSPWAQKPSASSEDVLPRSGMFTPPPPDEDSPWR